MELSKHNIIGKIPGTESWFIVNPLHRQADILEPELAAELNEGRISSPEMFMDKGYLCDPKDEEKLYRKEYLDFIDNQDSDEIQIFYVPTYACNFNCSYCYQEGYPPHDAAAGIEAVNAFFEYISSEFAGRRKYVTVFGGEPLLPAESNKAVIERIVEQSAEKKIDLAFVTNGYALKEYLPLLEKAVVREIQVTLDGTEDVHDARRPLKGGKPTFNSIVEGIDAALEAGITVNLRMVIDKENIDAVPVLSRFAIDRGWTSRPNFKTQLGRNYELHYCQSSAGRLYDRVGMYEALYDLILRHPEVLEFHRPAFSLSRFLFDEGQLSEPLFDSCAGCKTEWAFDYTGRIYSCTATVGKPGEELGTFYPERTLVRDIVDEWQDRDVTTIPECRDCSLQLACGGGCASIAKNKNGKLHSPDCRPVDKLLGLGIGLYFKDEIK